MGMFSRKKADEWLDWLADEQPADDVQAEIQAKKAHEKQPAHPEPTVIRPGSASPVGVTDHDRRERLRRAGVYNSRGVSAQPAQNPPKNAAGISININLPAFKRPKLKLERKQLQYWSAFSVAVIVSAVVLRSGLGMIQGGADNEKKDVQGASTGRAEPSFKPLAPEKKPNLSKPDGQNSQYDGKRDLFTFNDNFSGANIIVSQQPLPEPIKKDPAKVLQLTDSIGAKDKVVTAYGVAYYGTDEKSKVLRVVLINTNQNRLVFMQSDKAFDADSIKFYLESLR